MTITTLTGFAAQQQWRFEATTSVHQRKSQGHFGTPPVIARFMAAMFTEFPRGVVRILDPGAGVGTLSAAVCQRALTLKTRRHFEFELWENDTKLLPLLKETMEHCRESLRKTGHEVEFRIRAEDFILANAKRSLFDAGPEASFQLAILNPPYFKLRKESEQARAMRHVVHGQPNIYALFMAVAADLLLPEGELVAITPRSYFNGPYFKRFRKYLFDTMSARRIHVFGSRVDAFKNDSVLQENVILHAHKDSPPELVTLTSSFGRSLDDIETSTVAYEKIVDNSYGDHVVRVSTTPIENEILEAMDKVPQRFCDLDLEVSTGPVVSFRCTEFLRQDRSQRTAPLLWMHNVRPFEVRFPEKNGKPGHIEVCEASRRLLLPARRYVLLKRFTAKEEKRRMVAGIVNASDSYCESIGLENHLNYVYRKELELTPDEAFGLAAYFNSVFVDRYFRAISGNTQVNAAEIRALPAPNIETLARLGQEVQCDHKRSLATVEEMVAQALCLRPTLTDQLVEAAQ